MTESNPVQHLPAVPARVETGAVQFGDDWPGIFIRGDQAGYYAMTLRSVLETGGNAIERGMMGCLYDDLRSCVVGPARQMLPDLLPQSSLPEMLSADWHDKHKEAKQAGYERGFFAQQDRIDALMLEYCPHLMTSDQVAAYKQRQRLSSTVQGILGSAARSGGESTPGVAGDAATDNAQSIAELLHARGYVQNEGDIGRVAHLLRTIQQPSEGDA